jgi:hypothetical protein
MRERALLLSLALGLAAPRALAAPMGAGVEPVTVLTLESEDAFDFATKTFTNALRQRVLDAPEYTVGDESPMLYLVAREAKCSLKVARGAPVDERAFDDACLRKIAKHLGIKRFFWGVIAANGGRPVVRLHLWQEGQPGRSASLPYNPDQRDRIAERLYRKLVRPNAVGDLALSGGLAGELFVDGKPSGPYVDGTELTLDTGEHAIEVHDGPRVLSRGRARIEPGGRSEVRLTPVAEPAPSPPPPGPAIPPPITVRPRPSAWPWVLGGVGVAGLAGAGAFWALRQGERSDLGAACFEKRCPERESESVDRGRTLTVLSAASLGVGVAAGAGLATYLLTPRRAPPVAGAVVPLVGGAAATIGGTF